jgi:hypothetical protein
MVADRASTWSGPDHGQNTVTFQAPGPEPFPDGHYALMVFIGDELQSETQFKIGEPVNTTEVLTQPTFGAITFAQGVETDGSPVLVSPEGRFGRDTVIVYAIFEYEGMREGTPWSAVWERGEDEVLRLESVWQAAAGEQGTYWVSYQEGSGPLPYGDYRLTLSIEGRQQQVGTFQVSRR